MDVRSSRDAINTASKSRKGSLDVCRRRMVSVAPGTMAGGGEEGRNLKVYCQYSD
jgi:hypothetical protein